MFFSAVTDMCFLCTWTPTYTQPTVMIWDSAAIGLINFIF